MVTKLSELEKIYAEEDEKKRKAFHPFQCGTCGRIIKITYASSGYGIDGHWWSVEGVCSKCGQVSEGG